MENSNNRTFGDAPKPRQDSNHILEAAASLDLKKLLDPSSPDSTPAFTPQK